MTVAAFNSSNIIIIGCDQSLYPWVTPGVPTFCCDITANDFQGDCCEQHTAVFTYPGAITTTLASFGASTNGPTVSPAAATSTNSSTPTTDTSLPTTLVTSWSVNTAEASVGGATRKPSSGAIVGIAIGAVVGISILTVLLFLLLRRHGRKRDQASVRERQGTLTTDRTLRGSQASGPSKTAKYRNGAHIASWSVNVGAPSVQESYTKEVEGSSPTTYLQSPGKVYPGFEARSLPPTYTDRKYELPAARMTPEIGSKSECSAFSGEYKSGDRGSQRAKPDRMRSLKSNVSNGRSSKSSRT